MAEKRVYLGLLKCAVVIMNSETGEINCCPNTSKNSPGKGCPKGHPFWVCEDHYNFISCCMRFRDNGQTICGESLIRVVTKIKL